MGQDHIEIVTIACLSDNYAFLIHNHHSGDTALVDVPEAAPIQNVSDEKNWQLRDVILTHHHWDHVEGLEALNTQARIIGGAADQHRLPPLDLAVHEGDALKVCGMDVQVIDVPGHTVGHLAFYMPDAKALFSADSLMAMGCGRLFEGTPAQMWDSLQKLRDLPDDTVVYSGHEYMRGNLAFALSLGEENPALAIRAAQENARIEKGQATVPSLLADEKATNPFLRADDSALKAALGMAGASDVDVFTEIRHRKDVF